MTSLIVRVRNRLEYTIRMLNALAEERTAKNPEPFEVVIVNDGSDDGTHEWLSWIAKNKAARDWFGGFRYTRHTKHLGDFGGMREGLELARGEYVAQLDNDALLSRGSLRLCRQVVQAGHADVAMPKRVGVRRSIEMRNERTVKVPDGKVRIADVEFCVMFYVLRGDVARAAIKKGARNARQFTKLAGRCVKLPCVFATHMEGFGTMTAGVDYAQTVKYPKPGK